VIGIVGEEGVDLLLFDDELLVDRRILAKGVEGDDVEDGGIDDRVVISRAAVGDLGERQRWRVELDIGALRSFLRRLGGDIGSIGTALPAAPVFFNQGLRLR
jgi:hypothetical protein